MPRIILRNLAAIAAFQGINALLFFILVMVISRAYGVVGVAHYAFSFSFTTLISMFFSFGIDEFIIREMARRKEDILRYTGLLLPLRFLTGGLAYVVMVVLALALGVERTIFQIILIAGMIPFVNHLDNCFYAGFWSVEKIHYKTLTDLVQDLIGIPLALFFIWIGGSLLHVFLAILIGVVISSLFSWWLFVREMGRPIIAIDFSLWFSWIRRAVPFFFNAMMFLAVVQLDMVMVGLLTGIRDTGIFGAAFSIVKTLLISSMMAAMVFYPRLSILWVENLKRFRSLFVKWGILFAFCSAFLVLAIGLFASPIIVVVFGPTFVSAAPILRILLIAGFFQSLFGFLLVGLNAADRPWLNSVAFLLGFILNFILNLLLIPGRGGMGAAYATVISSGVTFLLGLIFLTRVVVRGNAGLSLSSKKEWISPCC